MNKIYRVVWNHCKRLFQVTSELGSSVCGKSESKATGNVKAITAGTLLLMALPIQAADLPSGGTIIGGQGNINGSDNTLNIQQNSQNLAINWQDFSIAEGHTVNFFQPNAQASALNRVTGNNVSDIRGALNANGRVFLVNPNGVMFSSTAKVDVGSLVTSTLDISTKDFMAGNYQFEGASANAIVNRGNITTADGGVVAMIAAKIINTGNISTPAGSTLMGAGSKVTLDLGGPVKIEVDEALLDTYIEQGGAIRADGGLVYLTAKSAGDLAASVINHTGVTEAHTLASGKDGRIMLMGDMQHGEIQVAGKLDASAPTAGDGGFIETSAAKVNINDVKVSTRAKNGQTGEWLIDPNDYTIAASGGDITGAQLGESLADTSITIKSVDGANADGNGDIFVNDAVTWSSGNTLTLNAIRNIEINSTIDASGGSGGKLVLQYGQGAAAIDKTGDYNINAPVYLQAGQNYTTLLGNDGIAVNYTVITELGAEGSMTGTDLQGINFDPYANYALGSSIDAFETQFWNDGWTPIGGMDPFRGNFDGLGHNISNLRINQRNNPNHGTGFFGWTSDAIIRNVSLTNIDIIGNENVGGLIGVADNTQVTNTSVSGFVTAEDSGGLGSAGGLIGRAQVSDIKNSYASANVTGFGNGTGGLVGYLSDGSINNSYAIAGSINGGQAVGGLVGYLSNGSITNSYAVTQNITSFSDPEMGGLVGAGNGMSVASSFWDTETSNLTWSAGGEGKTSAQMRSSTTYAGWDSAIWSVAGGSTIEGYEVGLPYLTNVTDVFDRQVSTLFAGGMGTAENAYTITDWNQLQNINYNAEVLSGGNSFILFNDLDANSLGYNEQASNSANSGSGWTSLGNYSTKFTGSFHGMGHRISGLNITQPDTDYVGLFGATQEAQIRNVSLFDVDVSGQSYVGGLVGMIDTTHIENASVSGSVTAPASRVGGLIGYAIDSIISHSFSSADVTGSSAVGGLVGSSGYDGSGGSTLFEVYASGDVKGTGVSIGGLAGESNGSIKNAYATGNVEGDSFVGGLVGRNAFATIDTSYSSGSVSGEQRVGGLVGEHVGEKAVTNSFYAVTNAKHSPINNRNDSTQGTGKTWDELTDPATFKDWDSTIWKFGPGADVAGYGIGLPYLIDTTQSSDIVISGTLFGGGWGTDENPYTIGDWQQLQNINFSNDLLSGGFSYSLTNNLDNSTNGYAELAGTDANGGLGWKPIGDYSDNPFIGSFNGDDYAIADLYVNRGNASAGLFGYIGEGSEITNIELLGGSVKGKYAGMLAGVNSGSIDKVVSTGVAEGDQSGGLVGLNDGGSATDSYYATTDADGNPINQDNDSGLGEGKTWNELMNQDDGNDDDGGETGGGNDNDGETDGGNNGGDTDGGNNDGGDVDTGTRNETVYAIASVQQLSSGLNNSNSYLSDITNNSNVFAYIQRQQNQLSSGGLALVETADAAVTEQSSQRDQSGLLPVFVVDGGLRLNDLQNADPQ
ncbi:GLUG motif-containing protein [Idiomarina loihiensis]|uniref:two-partner secretion domain-containing protein n=1 Tax=Idiomarina loihiensis TaxID=135577 RepID=UPI00384C7177